MQRKYIQAEIIKKKKKGKKGRKKRKRKLSDAVREKEKPIIHTLGKGSWGDKRHDSWPSKNILETGRQREHILLSFSFFAVLDLEPRASYMPGLSQSAVF